jgi:FkbM family methyltransferase
MWRLLLAERPWTHVIDVGANYGEMLVGVELPPAARVVALEPNERIAEYLQRTLRAAALDVEVVTSAASNHSDGATLTIDRNWSGLSSLEGVQQESAGHVTDAMRVPTVTLAGLLERDLHDGPIRLLVKIDVESHEIPVLQGLGDLPERVAEFAALVEILHASPQVLEWLIAHFAMEVFDLETTSLVPMSARTASEFNARLASGKYYRQDAVLRSLRSRRESAGGAA